MKSLIFLTFGIFLCLVQADGRKFYAIFEHILHFRHKYEIIQLISLKVINVRRQRRKMDTACQCCSARR